MTPRSKALAMLYHLELSLRKCELKDKRAVDSALEKLKYEVQVNAE